MKEKIGVIIVFFVFLFLFAKWGPSLNFASTTQSKGEPFVVTGEGKVFATPDIAKVSFGIEETGSSLKQAQDSVNKKSQTLAGELKNLGVDTKDIQTTSYSVYPQYDYTDTTQKVTGFQVSINYEVTIRNFDKVNEALVAGTNAGANVVGGISFEVNDKTQKEKLQEARKIAVAEAKEKAQGLASASGITLGKVINVSENSAPTFPQPLRTNALDLKAGGTPESS